MELPFACDCGAVRGVVVPGPRANPITCYCDDCQAWLERIGRTDLADEFGGTAVLQISQAELQFRSGLDRLGCRRLSEKGLLRWVATCCNTPVGNSMANPKLPFFGLLVGRLESEPTTWGPSLPVQTRFAREGHGLPGGIPLRPIVRGISVVASAWWRGDAARSPLFRDGAPIATPEVLPG